MQIYIIMRLTVMIVLLCFLFAVMDVCSQTIPYISFMNKNLPNNSYINLTLVGIDSNSVQCHTDLPTCCNASQGPDRGDWYFPNGTRLPFSYFSIDKVYESRKAQRVDLNILGDPVLLEGLYHCDIDIQTTAGNDGRETVYAGLYKSTNQGQYKEVPMYIVLY